MAKAIFIDTTVCTGCRGCQVACKQWKGLPAEKTVNHGSYQNPEDLSFTTYKLVRMSEAEIDKKLRWLFFADQCRHCLEPPCLETAGEPTAIYKDKATGAVIYTKVTKDLDTDDIIESCPYHIPRKGPDGSLAKCDLCIDRVSNGRLPACVQTCPTGAMNFGEYKDVRAWAQARLAEVRRKFPNAVLVNPDKVRVIYLTAFEPTTYWEYAIAAHREPEMTRALAMRRMVKPFAGIFARMAG
jgi:formate dehydrogenase iron-sulfur subunit